MEEKINQLNELARPGGGTWETTYTGADKSILTAYRYSKEANDFCFNVILIKKIYAIIVPEQIENLMFFKTGFENGKYYLDFLV